MDALENRRLELAALRSKELIREAERSLANCSNKVNAAQKLWRKELSTFEAVRQNLIARRLDQKGAKSDSILVNHRLQQLKASKRKLFQCCNTLTEANNIRSKNQKLLEQRELVGRNINERISAIKINDASRSEDVALEETAAIYCLKNHSTKTKYSRSSECNDVVNLEEQRANVAMEISSSVASNYAEGDEQQSQKHTYVIGNEFNASSAQQRLAEIVTGQADCNGFKPNFKQEESRSKSDRPSGNTTVESEDLANKIEQFLSWNNNTEAGVTFQYQSKSQGKYEILVKTAKRRAGVEIEIRAGSEHARFSLQRIRLEILRELRASKIAVAAVRIAASEMRRLE